MDEVRLVVKLPPFFAARLLAQHKFSSELLHGVAPALRQP